MRTLASAIFLTLFHVCLGVSQEMPEYLPLEIFVEQINVASEDAYTHTITAQGVYWDIDRNVSSDEGLGESSVQIEGSNEGMQNAGWDWNDNSEEYPHFGYALYKVTNTHSSHYFYIDYRDCNVGAGYGNGLDILIRYNAGNSSYSWCNNNPGPCSFSAITNGSTLTIWNMKNVSGPDTTSFQPTTPTDLNATPYNCNPRLTWTASSGYISGYHIYRNWGSGYQNIATVTGTTYTDLDVTWNGDYNNTHSIHYYVKAVNNSTESGASNTIQILIDPNIQKEGVSPEMMPQSTTLHQNYPNPFNPETRLSFDLAKELHVRLTIYNALGQRIWTLVDATLPGGRHELIWDGQQEDGVLAPSGIYIAEFATGAIREWRKMILLK